MDNDGLSSSRPLLHRTLTSTVVVAVVVAVAAAVAVGVAVAVVMAVTVVVVAVGVELWHWQSSFPCATMTSVVALTKAPWSVLIKTMRKMNVG